jgi:hypothetical protein
VDADYAEAKQNAKELKPNVRDLTDDTMSENDTPTKTTPAKKRTWLNQQQRMASKISDLTSRLEKAENKVSDNARKHASGPKNRRSQSCRGKEK